MIDVLSKLSVFEKIVPVLEAIVSEIGPTVKIVGEDSSQMVIDAEKLLNDLKDKMAEIKAVAVDNPDTKTA